MATGAGHGSKGSPRPGTQTTAGGDVGHFWVPVTNQPATRHTTKPPAAAANVGRGRGEPTRRGRAPRKRLRKYSTHGIGHRPRNDQCALFGDETGGSAVCSAGEREKKKTPQEPWLVCLDTEPVARRAHPRVAHQTKQSRGPPRTTPLQQDLSPWRPAGISER